MNLQSDVLSITLGIVSKTRGLCIDRVTREICYIIHLSWPTFYAFLQGFIQQFIKMFNSKGLNNGLYGVVYGIVGALLCVLCKSLWTHKCSLTFH